MCLCVCICRHMHAHTPRQHTRISFDSRALNSCSPLYSFTQPPPCGSVWGTHGGCIEHTSLHAQSFAEAAWQQAAHNAEHLYNMPDPYDSKHRKTVDCLYVLTEERGRKWAGRGRERGEGRERACEYSHERHSALTLRAQVKKKD